MRGRELIAEAWRTAAAQRASTLIVAALAAATVLTTLLTVGRTAAAETQIASRLDQAGSRVLTVQDSRRQELLHDAVIATIGKFDTVERAVGLSAPQDVTSGPTLGEGPKVPAWSITGELEDAADLTAGRWPGQHEAVLADEGARVLGVDGISGHLRAGDQDYAVVGRYRSRAPFNELDSGALLGSDRQHNGGASAASLHVVARDSSHVRHLQGHVLRVVAAPRPTDIDIRSPLDLAQLQQQVGTDVSRFGRTLLLLVSGGGAVLTALVVTAEVMLRRRDLGRRRALGASRDAVTALVTLRTFIAASGGTLVATGAGSAIVHAAGTLPPVRFIAGTAVVTLLTATAASLLPATIAARRDPVHILRTP
jgi:putative ABC transport system permease protein